MADAAINVFLGLANDVIRSNVDLISGVRDDFDAIRDDMERMRGFLIDAGSPECRESASLKPLVNQIRDVTYEAEDAIEQYVMYQYGGTFQKLMGYKNIHDVAQDFKKIRKRIQGIKSDKFYDIPTLRGPDNHKLPSDQWKGMVDLAKGDEVVGLEKETQKLIALLTSDSDERKVVLVAGMPGLGKTTLANKVYTDVKTIDYKFLYIVWIRVSQQYDRGDVLRQMWREVGDNSFGDPKEISPDINLDELTRHLHAQLAEKHCLMILDDVWKEQAWNELQDAFPRRNKNLRILITSRLSKVVPEAEPFQLDPLKLDKGFELLEKRVFRKHKCPVHLKDVATDIVSKCDGLPLAIVIIAGVLLQRHPEKTFWEDISKRVTENVAQKNCWEIVRLSYDNLPHHLRPCFLYFGIFPQSTPIAVSKLFNLWIAEGFIKAEEGLDSEQVAEKYLQDLVNRNLVLVEKTNSSNKIKQCRVHDILHDLCIQEAREENIFYQIKNLEHYLGEPTKHVNHRRISIHESAHSHVLKFLPEAKASGVLVRSLLSLGPDVSLQIPDKKTFPGPFQLLRVLDVLSILLPRLPDPLTKLLHLRYLGIYINFNTISKDFTKLSKLQIFVVKVKEGENMYQLKVDANIWQMYQLRHLQTNIPLYFSLSQRRIQQANKSPVRTISYVSPETCTLDFFAKIDTVKKLGIRGDFEKLPNVGFSGLELLEVLKMKNESSSNGKVSFFPGKGAFPSTIRQLTLEKTYLSWETHMEVIARLPTLAVLKLKDEAFVGKYWKPPSEGFLNLQVFLIGNTDLEIWDASSEHFPMLSVIILRFCEQLKSIPSDFVNLPSLQKLHLHNTNTGVASSAREIQKKKEQVSEVKFELSVFPSDH
ncbi:putative late blight resistance protein homolog R1B-8 isoform X2 [Silene latifolia]